MGATEKEKAQVQEGDECLMHFECLYTTIQICSVIEHVSSNSTFVFDHKIPSHFPKKIDIVKSIYLFTFHQLRYCWTLDVAITQKCTAFLR